MTPAAKNLEITETVAMADAERAGGALLKLWMVDDFGTG
jgi:hypothetical protein